MSLLQTVDKTATMQESVPERWRKLIWRLNKLESGKRYMIFVTVGERPDWTVQEIGKVER